MLIFHGSHHFANQLAKTTGSKVKTIGRRHYKVETDQPVADHLTRLGFTLAESANDEECSEQTYTLDQTHHIASACHQIAFVIKFHNEPNTSVMFSQRELPIS